MKGNRSMQDMTEGRPISLILKFFFPLLFGMLFQQFYNLVDTAIVGKFLGPDDLAAVGATGSVNFLILGFCMGVCNGFSIPVAQKFGAKDESGLRRFVANSVWLSVIFAAVMTVVVCILCRQILIWMDTPANILEGSYRYIFVIFLGIPVTYLYNLLSGIIGCKGLVCYFRRVDFICANRRIWERAGKITAGYLGDQVYDFPQKLPDLRLGNLAGVVVGKILFEQFL